MNPTLTVDPNVATEWSAPCGWTMPPWMLKNGGVWPVSVRVTVGVPGALLATVS